MTASTVSLDTEKQVGDPIPPCYGGPVAATTLIPKGVMAAIDASGNLVNASASSALRVVGRSKGTYDNDPGAAGAINGEVEQGTFRWANADTITASSIGDPAYAVDNTTVAKADGGGARPFAGIIVGVDTQGVWVLQGLFLRGLDVVPPDAVAIASLSLGFAQLTDADTQQTFDFASALPAGALVVGYGGNVTAIFDNVGDTASLTFDLGIASGDTDVWVDGGSLNAVAKVSTPSGTDARLVGAVTPSVIVDSSVNLNTITKGAAVFYVAYVAAF